jgi:hypothetical protein
MAFPTDLEIECAFNNDIDETNYAQSGWTSILPFVSSFSGDLRGRDYELDRTDAGSLSVVLDNSDGRFLPGSVQSPYYPYVKSDRRFRIRGKNMVHPNVARGGSRDRALQGFLQTLPNVVSMPYSLAVTAFDQVQTITASAEPNTGQGKDKVYDNIKATMWTINTQAGWIQYQYALGMRMTRYTLTIPAGNTDRNPKNWTLQGSNNGSSWTTIHTVTNNLWTEDYEDQEFTVTTPGSYLYYRLDITANTGAVANTQLSGWQLAYDAATDLPSGSTDLTHFVKTSINAGLAINTWHETVGWYVPLEYGVRLSHSAHVWRISGTEPTGLNYKFHVTYYDKDFGVIGSTEGAVDPASVVTTIPSSQTLTQLGFSHTPPSSAKYGVMSFAIYIGGTTNATPLVYGITGIQSELPVNLAPDISAYRDTFSWQIETAGTSGTVKGVPTTGVMGNIVEATSPVFVSGNTTTITTASFTPANNSLLVAMCAAGNGTKGVISLGTVTDSLAGAWTRKVSDLGANGGLTEIWIRDVGTGAAMTVTYDPGGTVASGVSLQVQVLTGAKPVAQQTGAIASNGGVESFTKAITTTAANSRIYGSFARPDTAVTLSTNASTELYGQISGSASDVGAAMKSGVISITQAVPIGFTNIDTAGQRIALIEILAANQTALDPTTAYLSVTWGVDDSNAFITVPHLIPGERYTATVDAKKLTGQPDVLFSGDEGETGALVNTTSFAQYTIEFEAQQPEQELRFILQGIPTATEGLQIRKLKVQYGAGLALTLPASAVESGVTTWLRPKDIFEGWVERWPAVAGQLDMTVTVVDRLKRLGEVELSNTLKETLLQDGPVLLLPLTDSMLDTPGRFSQLGKWADEEGGPSYVDITASRGDLGASSYTTQTDDGPTGEASFKNNPADTGLLTGKGYFFAIPYSKDYTAPVVKPAPKPAPRPVPATPTPTAKAIYTKKWYATWSRSYEGDFTTRFDDSPYMYQGQFTGSPGNQRSLAGFDYKNIAATLSGAEVLEVSITVRNYHARWNKGLYVFIGSHNHTSKPSTWSAGSTRERRWKKWVVEGGSVTLNPGITFGNELKSGSSRGIAIGPETDSDNYGFFYGASHSNRPSITIRYRK